MPNDDNDPQHWPDDNPLKVKALVSQREEFRERTRRAKQALEDARTAFERGDMVELERILFANTSMFRKTPAKESYPLWCLDSGDPHDEHRFSGPYDTEAEASEYNEHAERKGFGIATLRRCRRLRPSELDAAKYAAESLREHLEDDATSGGVPTECWANWDESLVEYSIPEHQLLERFTGWLDANVHTKICICEGDEEQPDATTTKIDVADAAERGPS